jgi:mannosyltransferase OCH1-like enzyme
VIPKVFHTIWVQGELPDEYRPWFDSWLAHHPNWQHRLWSEADFLPLISDCNRAIYDTAVNHAQRAEIASKEILLRLGGVFLDADFECLRNIDGLLKGVECFTGQESPGQLSAGIVGAVPDHPAVRVIVDDITRSIVAQRDAGREQNHGAGPWILQRLWRRRDDVTVFPPEVFYPYLWTEPKPSTYPATAYAAHHWKATWK